jgi:hypothetical protein
VVDRGCRSREGLRVHRVDKLDTADCAHKRGIPTTSPARAIVDFAATASSDELEHALTEAYANGLTDERGMLAAIERVPTHAGVALLRAILRQPGGPQRTRSGRERAMLKLIRAAGLPAPRTNVARRRGSSVHRAPPGRGAAACRGRHLPRARPSGPRLGSIKGCAFC